MKTKMYNLAPYLGNCKKLVFTLIVLAVINVAQAKVWRVNNNPGVTADFTTIPLAVANAAVVNDDTLHIEASATQYANFTLNKRLVIIGTGYFLSGANSNVGLQQNANASLITFVYVDTLGSGSQLMGLDFSDGVYTLAGSLTNSGADNITITRCKMQNFNFGFSLPPTNNNSAVGWVVNKCHIATVANATGFKIQNLTFTNNIVTATLTLNVAGNLNNLIRNNIFRSSIDIINAYFANNIIQNASIILTTSTVKNNLTIGAPVGFAAFVGINGNISNNTDANLFQGITANSIDGQWRLKAGSAAIGAGENIGGIIPDCGAFGTADPYVLSGIPAIPTIYLLTVPTSVPSTATTMNITISTKSNN
jgi:hypothetical protein